MTEIVTISLDLAKNVFQVHGIDADGRVSIRCKLQRAEVLRFAWAILRRNEVYAAPAG